MLFGALASMLPDVDVLGAFFLSDHEQLLFHRGITHSFLFVILFSIAAGWIISKIFIRNTLTWMNWTSLLLAGTLSHILIDSLTCYGTGWFEPFSHSRVSFNTIFVADPFYTLPLLFCLIVGMVAKNNSPKRRNWTWAGLGISTAYLIFTIVNHGYVHGVMRESFTDQKLVSEEFTVTPTPLNNFLWMAYSSDKHGAWIGFYSVFDNEPKVDFHRVDRNDSLLLTYGEAEVVTLLKQFSQGNYFISNEDTIIYFTDIRFGYRNGWGEKEAPYAFQFNLGKDADNSMALNRTKHKISKYEVLKGLVKRIKGK